MPENTSNSELNGDHEPQKQDESTDDIPFDPILPLLQVPTNEEDESELIKMRAKLYRYDASSNPGEWKERGTGEVKLLRHTTKHTVRVVMRRDKTLKVCANHFITPVMELKPNCNSDRAWVYSVLADFADEELKPELLAIRFANSENAWAWKEAFEKAKTIVRTECGLYNGEAEKEDEENDEDSCSEESFVSVEETKAEDSLKNESVSEETEDKDKENEVPGKTSEVTVEKSGETEEKNEENKDIEKIDKIDAQLKQLNVSAQD